MIVESTRLGKQLDIDPASVIQFPVGLPGFDAERQFALISAGGDACFWFMQSLADANLTLLLVDPFVFFSDYQFELDAETAAELQLANGQSPQIFAVVTVPEAAEQMTANLLAPIIVNHCQRLGRQIVLAQAPYTTQHRLFPQGFVKPKQQGGE